MSYLIDTNVLSELRRKQPDPGVVEWFARHPARSLYLSVLTLGEIRKGIEGVADATRRQGKHSPPHHCLRGMGSFRRRRAAYG